MLNDVWKNKVLIILSWCAYLFSAHFSVLGSVMSFDTLVEVGFLMQLVLFATVSYTMMQKDYITATLCYIPMIILMVFYPSGTYTSETVYKFFVWGNLVNILLAPIVLLFRKLVKKRKHKIISASVVACLMYFVFRIQGVTYIFTLYPSLTLNTVVSAMIGVGVIVALHILFYYKDKKDVEVRR